jgi:serine protease DegQ
MRDSSASRSTAVRRLLAICLCIALCLAAFASAALARTPLLDEQRGVLTLAPVLEKVTPAVVSISVQSRVPTDNPLFRDPFFRRFFGLPDIPERQIMSAGSGVIVDAAKGHVVTNHHVVRNADRITVTVKDGRQFPAKLIGSDEATDIALLDIEASGLAELPLGDSDALKVGDVVLAIGNPFGLSQTVTSGIVSALGRAGVMSADSYEDFIQIDAPINPGNSGGALINSKGELMGINTAIITPAGGNVGIGFAVPANIARAVVDQLLRYGEVRRGRIGVTIQTATPDIAKALGAPVQRGVVINSIQSNSPAEKAGLRAGDLIISIDGKPVADANDVRTHVGLREPGSKVEITYYRDGKTNTVTVPIREPKVTALEVWSAAPQLAGARFTEIPADHPAKGRVEGLLVAEVEAGSAAWRTGLRAGDIVVAVNQQPVTSVADLEKATSRNPSILTLNILRGDAQLFIVAQG